MTDFEMDDEGLSICEKIDEDLWDLGCFAIDTAGDANIGIQHLIEHLNKIVPLLMERGPNPPIH